jgi:glutamate formiminotransferase / 5-formyltetrahydrofolate cyclo-ligase
MQKEKKIIQCVPNYSEGRDLEKIEKLVEPFRGKEGVKLLDYTRDEDHNRVVVTVVGEPQAVKNAMLQSMKVAVEIIDLRTHKGQHPRMGAVDVVPFIPVKSVTMEEAIALSKEFASEAAEMNNVPIFLYEKSASNPNRENLATIRKGEFEGMAEKMTNPEWKPDYGPTAIHESAGVTAVGARMPLVAFNVNLDTENLDIANNIAKNVRFIGGGLRYCKAMGVALTDRKLTQVSMNMTDYTKTALYRALELVKIEARRYGVNIVGSEIIGIVPMEALIQSAVFYMGIEDFTMDQVLENRLME